MEEWMSDSLYTSRWPHSESWRVAREAPNGSCNFEGQAHRFESVRTGYFCMIWSIAADDALVGFGVDTFLVNHNAREMGEESLHSIVIRSRNVGLEDFVDFLYAGDTKEQ